MGFLWEGAAFSAAASLGFGVHGNRIWQALL
jgi:hypothetical protein